MSTYFVLIPDGSICQLRLYQRGTANKSIITFCKSRYRYKKKATRRTKTGQDVCIFPALSNSCSKYTPFINHAGEILQYCKLYSRKFCYCIPYAYHIVLARKGRTFYRVDFFLARWRSVCHRQGYVRKGFETDVVCEFVPLE